MSLLEALVRRNRVLNQPLPVYPAYAADEEDNSPDDNGDEEDEILGVNALRKKQAATDALMEKKWEMLLHPAEIFRKINASYATLAAILSHPTFSIGGGSVQRTWQQNAGAMFARANASELSHNIMMVGEGGKGGLEIKLNLPELKCIVKGLLSQPNAEQAAAHEQGRKLLKALFPNLDVNAIELSKGIGTTPMEPRTLPMEGLAAIKIPDVEPVVLADWGEQYRNIVKFTLTPKHLVASQSQLATNLTDHTEFAFDVGIDVTLTMPREFILWSTSSTDEDYSPLISWTRFKAIHNFLTKPPEEEEEEGSKKKKKKVEPPENRTKNPNRVGALSKATAEKFNLQPRVMTNAEGICSIPKGKLYWIPPASEMNIPAVLNSCLVEPQEDKNGTKFTIDFTALAGRHVSTDWFLNKMICTDKEGVFHLVDINGARPPSPVALAHVMTGFDRLMFDRMCTMAEQLGSKVDTSILDAMYDVRSSIGEKVTWENMIDVPIYGDFGADAQRDLISKRIMTIGTQFSEAYTKLVSSNIPVWDQFEVRPYFALFGAYGNKRGEFAKALTEQTALHRAAINPDAMPELHDMGGVDGLMPHQTEVSTALNMNPEGAILDISAGGGKSFAMIEDISDLMHKGKIRRPVIVMPRNLLAQFGKELVRFTKGNLRPFIVSSRTWTSISAAFRHGIDPKAFISVMQRQPRNTVFCVDYGWLALRSVGVECMDQTSWFYPHAAIIASLQPDYISADESQRAKNEESGRTEALGNLYSLVKYRRIASGTILHNTNKDYIGQMGLIEPMALDVLRESLNSGKLAVNKENKTLIDRNITRFARRIQVPRRKWAHLLPPIFERVHTCEMTRNQANFSKKCMDDVLAQIMSDKKLQKLLQKDPEKAEKAMEALLKRNCVPLEIWLNAPDSTRDNAYGNAFSEIEGIQPEDLISPKVALIDEIIDKHIAGFRADIHGNNVETEVAPDPNKIIIACYNKAVTEHIFKHSKHASKGVYYTAGNDLALLQFKSDAPDSPLILYADETSINEGHNLQMASRLIRTQSLWTPGAQEQMQARIWRPDVPDKNGVIKYPRARIWIDWVIISPSIETAKMARLLSKLVQNQILQEQDPVLDKIVDDNPRVFAKVKQVKMNLDLLRSLNLDWIAQQKKKESGVPDMLYDQFQAYGLVKNWEANAFANERKVLREKLEKRVGRKVKDSELMRLAQIPVQRNPKLPGIHNTDTPEFDPGNNMQGQGYIPWAEGFCGWNPTSLHLVPLSPPDKEKEEDEDDEEAPKSKSKVAVPVEETVHVEVGDPVLTEYGPGIVAIARKNSVYVQVYVPGFRKEYAPYWRQQVLGATNDVDREALRALINNGKKPLPILRYESAQGTLTPVNNRISEQEIVPLIVKMQVLEKKKKLPTRPINLKSRDIAVPLARTGIYALQQEALRKKREAQRLEDQKNNPNPEEDDDDIDVPDSLIKKPKNVSRSPGLKKNDPFINKKGAQDAKRPIPPSKPKPPSSKRQMPQPPQNKTLDMRRVNEEDLWDTHDAGAIVLNGLVAIMTLDGSSTDSELLQAGFERFGKSVEIRCKNPKGYKLLVEYLATKFFIPRPIKKYLDQFGDMYVTRKETMAYAKSKELQLHTFWKNDQRKKASQPKELRPWPVVKWTADGVKYVSLVISRETCPAANKLATMPIISGVYPAKAKKAFMVRMVKNVAEAKELIKGLEKQKIRFADKDELFNDLRNIKNS